MEPARQRKTVEVDKGLFLIRYATAEDEARPPKVKVAVDPQYEERVELVLHPAHSDAVMWQPGSCVVVRATGTAQVAVEVIPSHVGGSVAATVKIEPLTQGKPAPAAVAAAADEEEAGLALVDLGDFRVLGHVAGIGDVRVGAGEWLAGPAAPSRIEGISVEWPGKPDDLAIRYAVKLARPQTVSGRMMELGAFAGTRGRALPIVGVTLEMLGPAAADYQFAAEAVFLGYPAMRVSGKRVVLAGPTGREPLVGFRLRLEDVNAQPRPAPKPVQPARASSRVRVFRSRTKQDQPLAS